MNKKTKNWLSKWGALIATSLMTIMMVIVLIQFAFTGDIALPGEQSTASTTTPSASQPPVSTPDTYYPPTSNKTDSYVSLGMFEKFGIVGDSYTKGTVYILNSDGTLKSAGYYENLEWGNIMAKKLGTKCTNFSWGGLSTRTWLTDSHGLAALLAAEPQNIYYLMLGINDKQTYGSENIGSLADIRDDFTQNADTFYGNYGKIICHIKAHAPEAKIIISTMTGVTSMNKLYNDAIEEIAEHFGIPCAKQYEYEFFSSDF